MNKELAKIFLGTLYGATYLDRTAGVVQVVIRKVMVDQENGISIERRVPYSDSATFEEAGKMSQAMVPDSKYKSCLYFEDQGIAVGDTFGGRGPVYTSRLRVVCWLNMERIVGAYDTAVTTQIMADVIKRIRALNNSNKGVFISIRPKVVAVPIQDAAIFSPYNYDETVSQYLMPPFDFFALDIETTFTIGDPCIQSFTDNIIV